jgi:hypothetical protein
MRTDLSNTARMSTAFLVIGCALAFAPSRAADAVAKAAVPSGAAKSMTNGTTAKAASATNAPARAVTDASAATVGIDYASFRQIADRNIFNAGRSSRSARGGEEKPRLPQVDTFTVVGTMSYAKGEVAFFDGSSALYRKAVKIGETIAGHKVVAVTPDEVRMEADGKPVTMKVGAQMRREDEGPWKVSAAGVSHAVAAPSAPSAPSATSANDAGDEAGEVLKRLLQKRQQEEKNENP